MKKIICLLVFCFSSTLIAQSTRSVDTYTYKEGDPNGTGKWYMGREIAYVMGFQGMSWLERPEREKEENTTKLLQHMNLTSGDVIADIGAGSGYHVFKMSSIAKDIFVYAVDIQDEMLAEMNERIKDKEIDNVALVKGSEKSVNLAENSVNKILMVDVYHEFSYPIEMLASIKSALLEAAGFKLERNKGNLPWQHCMVFVKA